MAPALRKCLSVTRPTLGEGASVGGPPAKKDPVFRREVRSEADPRRSA